MEQLSKIFPIRFRPSTFKALRQVSRQMGCTPSAVVRLCVQAGFDPHDPRSRFAMEKLRKAVDKKQ
jgi:hypothetical protein